MHTDIFSRLCNEYLAADIRQVTEMKQSGSERRYYRLYTDDKTVIGVFNKNIAENRVFFNLQTAFSKLALPVPTIYGIDPTEQYYICSDNGKKTLFDIISKDSNGNLDAQTYAHFEEAIKYLTLFQTSYKTTPQIFDLCSQPIQFDLRAIMWDLNYFKYNFLKIRHIPYNENALEDDFDKLANRIASIKLQGFMYRDFQSRNIMIDAQRPVFIDFQGGRRGPLQYDLVSFLWQAGARLSEHDKEQLTRAYINCIQQIVPNIENEFLKDLDAVILLRLMQVLGAYGFRGIIERKMHFLKSMPLGIKQLVSLWKNTEFKNDYPELNRCIEKMTADIPQQPNNEYLTIDICSFSYINGGYPADISGHGGGYVFDCRSLPNPGRLEEYKQLTGKDIEVIKYLKQLDEVDNFIKLTYKIVEHHAQDYQNKNLSSLSVAYGCTGGQHRSVYCAEELAKRLTNNGFNVKLWHREFPKI